MFVTGDAHKLADSTLAARVGRAFPASPSSKRPPARRNVDGDDGSAVRGTSAAMLRMQPAAGCGMVLDAQLGVDHRHANLVIAGQRADYLSHPPPWRLHHSRSVAQDLDHRHLRMAQLVDAALHGAGYKPHLWDRCWNAARDGDGLSCGHLSGQPQEVGR